MYRLLCWKQDIPKKNHTSPDLALLWLLDSPATEFLHQKSSGEGQNQSCEFVVEVESPLHCSIHQITAWSAPLKHLWSSPQPASNITIMTQLRKLWYLILLYFEVGLLSYINNHFFTPAILSLCLGFMANLWHQHWALGWVVMWWLQLWGFGKSFFNSYLYFLHNTI